MEIEDLKDPAKYTEIKQVIEVGSKILVVVDIPGERDIRDMREATKEMRDNMINCFPINSVEVVFTTNGLSIRFFEVKKNASNLRKD